MFRITISLFFLTAIAFAQNIGGSLSGSIQDSQGLAVENAIVKVRSLGSGAVVEIRSGTAGFYQIPVLAAGSYDVSIDKDGFETIRFDAIEITVGSGRSFKAVLAPRGQRQSVTVNAVEGIGVKSEASASYGAKLFGDLPMVSGGTGRSFRTQVYVTPGVTQSTAAHRPFSVGGARNRNNNYLIDSNDFNEIEGGLLMGRGSSEQLISTEAIDGIQVLTHNFKAEYGRQNGSVISMITKRGGNEWHGLAYEYLRNEKLDARNTFDTFRAPLRYNQFGVNAGGPVRKNKTFLFGNAEWFIRRQTNAARSRRLQMHNVRRRLSRCSLSRRCTRCRISPARICSARMSRRPATSTALSFAATMDRPEPAADGALDRAQFVGQRCRGRGPAALQHEEYPAGPQPAMDLDATIHDGE